MDIAVTHRRAGLGYAALAAIATGLVLLLPTLLLGVTVTVIRSVLVGEIVAWRSVEMTYVFLGVPALIALVLAFIPYRLFRAASRRLGTPRATRWVGGMLVLWNAAIALLWVRAASGVPSFSERPEAWYAVAFGIVAAVILVGTVAAERRAKAAAVGVVAGLGGALVVLVALLVAAWDSPPRVPLDAQIVRIAVAASEVQLDPATVRAGEVYFVVDGAGGSAGHSEFTFVSACNASQSCETPRLPLSDEAVARLARGDYLETFSDGGWTPYAKMTLLEGKYAFLITEPGGGEQPGIAPTSTTVLEVLP